MGKAGVLPGAAAPALSAAMCRAGAAPIRKTKPTSHQQGNIHAD